MTYKFIPKFLLLPTVAVAAAVGLSVWSTVRYTPLEASSHREAPLIADDPVADNTDLYAFKDPNDAGKIIIIANYIPFELPHGGPNYSTFGENVRYEIHVKNNAATTSDDITYRFTFTRTNDDPSTFFNIRLNKQNLRTTYTCEKITASGTTTIVSNGVVPPNNIGPRSINGGAGLNLGLNTPYETLRTNAIATASSGERILCGPADDPFFADLGAIFDLANVRGTTGGGGTPTDGLSHKNCHTIALSIPVENLQKTGKTIAQAANILDSDYIIGVWASASRPAMQTLSSTANPTTSGTWVQVSRLGMPLTNEVINPIGGKDAWNARTPGNEAAVTDTYLSNPELGLYMADNVPMNGAAPKPTGQTYYGEAIPNVKPLRVQTKSLAGLFPASTGLQNGFDFRNGAPGLAPLFGNAATNGTALAPSASGGFGEYLLNNGAAGSPRSVDLKPIFHTGVPNLIPYQLATGKTGGNPLTAGKPFINNFLPVFGDMLRLNMAVPATPRTSPDFSNQGLLKAAVLGLTDTRFNASADLQNIPNMDGFPNGRRLEDAVDQIELKAVSGVVLAAIGLWYDDYTVGMSPSPVTPQLGNVLGYTTGVEANDTTIRATFPFVQTPWSGTGSASGPTNVVVIPDLMVSTAMPVESGTYNNVTITGTGAASFNGPIVVNGTLTVQTGGTLSTQGVLATNCQAITGPGNFVLQAGATLRVCASDGISPTGGTTGAIQVTGTRTYSNDATYEFIGGDAQTTGTGLPSRVRGLTVNNAAGVTLNNGGVSVAQQVTLTNGNLITSTSQMLTLLSTPTAGTALVVNTNGAVTGPATMQRAIDPTFNAGAGYRHYSSPMVSTTLGDLTTTPGFSPIFNTAYNTAAMPKATTPFPNVFGYDQSRVTTSGNAGSQDFDLGFFVPTNGASTTMTPLVGYDLNIAASSTADLMGTLNTGPVSISNLARGTQTQSGWQLLGNPYPSPIDFSQTTGVTLTNMNNAVYVYQSTGQYVGQYRSYVNGMGGSPQVASMQGFFMRVATPGTPGSVALTNAARVTSFATTPSFNRTTADTRPQVHLRLQGSTPLIDEAYVYFEKGATADFDSFYDAYKLPNSSGLSVGSLTATNELSVNGLAPLVGTTTVPLNVQVPAVGSYSLNALDLLNFDTSTQVYLLDNQTGARIDLSKQPVYSFTASATSLPGRFVLSFGPNAPLAATPSALAQQVQLFPNPAHGSFTLVVPADLGHGSVSATLFNQLGQVVTKQTLPMTAAGATAQFDVSYLTAGVYTLQLKSGDNQVVKRVVVAN